MAAADVTAGMASFPWSRAGSGSMDAVVIPLRPDLPPKPAAHPAGRAVFERRLLGLALSLGLTEDDRDAVRWACARLGIQWTTT